MVHAYHVIIPMYGFWLPNDPRGSWSDTVRKWELLRFGPATKGLERRRLDELTADELARREAAKRSLRYPAVSLTGHQALTVAKGFARQCDVSDFTIWAASIMPEHTHLVIARHTYGVEQMVNLLKGAATRRCIESGCHPLADWARPGKRPPRMWAEHEWKVFLDSEAAIEEAINYVEQNPVKESFPVQHWSFVTPFSGIPTAWTTYHW